MVFILIPSLPWPDCKLFNIVVSILMNIPKKKKKKKIDEYKGSTVSCEF
jgi:hypothetical protein